jgi:ankyrin repeat protein
MVICVSESWPSRRSVHPLIHTINAGVDEVVELFSPRSQMEPEVVRMTYLRGMISMFVGLMGTDLIDLILAPIRAGSRTVNLDGLDSKRAALMAAAYLGRIDDMEALLMWCIQNTADSDKWLHLPLIAAAFSGQVDIIQFLLKRGVDRNAQTVMGDTALHFAALAGHVALVEYLLGVGVKADVSNNAGHTPFLWAAGGGHTGVVRVLLMTGKVNVNFQDCLGRTPLIWAAARGFDNVVKELLEKEEIDVNLADGDAEVAEVFRVTPLAMAAVMGKEDVFQRLFHHPKVDREVYMVFQRALIGGKASIVRTIIEALPNTLEVYQHDEYETALIMSTAYEEGSEEVVRYLLSLNTIPINYKGFGGRSAIHYAVRSGDLGKVRALLEHPDIDVNLTTIEYGCQSPLHCAADQERLNLEIMKALLAHPDIIVNSRDRFARTPLAFAAYNGQAEMVKLLLLRDDVDLFPVDEYGNTPLLIAAEAGESLVVSILLEVANTDVWHKNHGNRTALALAAESGHTEVVRQLLRPGLEVPRKIVREAAKHTRKALATTEDKLRTIPSYGKGRHANVNVRRIEEAHKLLLAFLHS